MIPPTQRIVRIIYAVLLFWMVVSPPALARDLYPFASAAFEVKMRVTGPDGKTERYAGQGWYKQGMWRMDVERQGQIISELYDGENAYVFFRTRRMAIQVPLSEIGLTEDGVPEYQYYGGEHVGEDRVGNETTDVYEYEKPVRPIPSLGARQIEGMPRPTTARVRTWIWRGKAFPLRWEMSAGGTTIERSLHHVVLDVPLPDDAFQLPSEVAVQSAVPAPPDRMKRLEPTFSPGGTLGMEVPHVARSAEGTVGDLPRGVPVYPGAEKIMHRHMAGGMISVASYVSADSVETISQFYQQKMKRMGWWIRVKHEGDEETITCERGVASCIIGLQRKKGKTRISLQIR